MLQFDNCRAEEERNSIENENENKNGGSIYCYSHPFDIIITLCEFINPFVYYWGGGMYINSVSKYLVYNSDFYNCVTGAHDSGGIEGFRILEETVCHRNSFYSCTAKYSAGGLRYESLVLKQEEVEKGCINSCKFINCKATNYYGGGIDIHPPQLFKMQNTIFVNGYAGYESGGFYFYSSNQLTFNPKLFYFCYFENNTAGTRANDVLLNVENVNKVKENPFILSFSKSEDKRFCYWNGTLYFYDWIINGTLNCYVGSK